MIHEEAAYERKYIMDLIAYYKTNPKYINNSKIKYYLMLHRLYPGTNGYRIIEKYFQSHMQLQRSIFHYINRCFKPFFQQMYDFYSGLCSTKVEGKKILKYRNMLTDFFCWLILNDIPDFRKISPKFCIDYIHSRNFMSVYSLADLEDFSFALHQYMNISFNINASFESILITDDTVTLSFDLNDQQMKTLINQLQDAKLKMLITFILYLGLPAQILANLESSDLDLYNQCIKYKGLHSGHRLICPFDNQLKQQILSMYSISGNQKIFSSSFNFHENYFPVDTLNRRLTGKTNFESLYRNFSFHLLNTRLPAKDARKILENLHKTVLTRKYFRN